MKTDSKTRGVTLVEVMVTLAILGVLLGLAWPTLADMISRHRVTVVAAEVRSNLVYARSEANRQDKRLQVNFGGNAGMSCYTVYLDTGPVGGCDCTKAPGQACSGVGTQKYEVKTVQLKADSYVKVAAGGTFQPGLEGRLSFTGPQLAPFPLDFNVLVTGTRVGKLLINISPLGRLSTCTPDQSMPGVASC